MRTAGSIVLGMSLLMLAGCSTLGDVVSARERGQGTARVYAISSDRAYDIAKEVFREEGSDAIEEHREEGYMLTSSGVNGLSWGTVMGAWVASEGPASTEVTVITKRRVSINLFTTLTETTFHRRFEEKVTGENRESR